MAIQLVIREDQLRDLSIIRDIEVNTIRVITDKLKKLDPPPLKPSDLRNALKKVLHDKVEEIDSILRQLMSLYTLCRERDITAKDVLKGIWYGLNRAKDRWTEEEFAKWTTIEPYFLKLLSLQNVWTVIKALDLSYEYANLLQSTKIFTDIRPVFDKNADHILGSVVTYTLRLRFDSLEGNKSLSIALDEKDIKKLSETCDRALKKAIKAKDFMNVNNKSTFISGEES